MALDLSCSTPTRREQLLSFETASLESSSSPEQDQDPHTQDDSDASPQRFNFTPRRVTSLPRAWERRPATPHLPRNEAQKIWKRVPLASVNMNQTGNWRKGDGQPIMRPVKRLRVTHIGQQEQDKENIDYVNSKWDKGIGNEAESPKRKVAHLVDWDLAEEQKGSPLDVDGHNVDGAVESRSQADMCEDISPLAADLKSDDELATQSGVEETSRPVRDPNTTTESVLISQENLLLRPTCTLSVDHDDTAYLNDFLSRARAQKAARSSSSLETVTMDGEAVEEEDLMEENEETEVAENGTDSDGIAEVRETVLAPQDDTEANLCSPRRSSRLITRLPRPQKPVTSVPSSITLKRLNGTEFISMQKETQSLALTTRTNTKRNKGLAQSVQQRLRQLDAEARVKQPEIGGVEGEASKKKRKKAKEVGWAEELARCQDGTIIKPSAQATEMNEAEVDLPVQIAQVYEGENITPAVEEQQEKKQIKKVRKLRKLNVGTVNGTPAPKKTQSLEIAPAPAINVERDIGMSKASKDGDRHESKEPGKSIRPPSAGILKEVPAKTTRSRRRV
ncbi:hypothetical protein PV10_01552 [Exophiala mesophila]|uniref:Uncharacterized protein n=1 Tax=Exophiala mesophila TaxID=212818 RepID=A0A0D1ZTC8_EXOME|nr:uncharacterized protein PV10_01552 [Exophiala mesophila]KIV97847.1 hypothetical protein PV10_01552 [Exophiala mesophila]